MKPWYAYEKKKRPIHLSWKTDRFTGEVGYCRYRRQGYAYSGSDGGVMTWQDPWTCILILSGSGTNHAGGKILPRIQGVKIVGTAEIIYRNKSLARDRGDILFANYGVSGPPILQISRKAGELMNEGKEAFLKISIIDTMSREELRNLMQRRLELAAKKPLDFSLVGLINKRLIPVILGEVGLTDVKRPVTSLSAAEREGIVKILTDWRFKVRGTKGWSSPGTAGGVDTREVDPQTMQSRLVPGLFFAGEVLDIDGLCGGFNLQWAWSSGYIAGQHAVML